MQFRVGTDNVPTLRRSGSRVRATQPQPEVLFLDSECLVKQVRVCGTDLSLSHAYSARHDLPPLRGQHTHLMEEKRPVSEVPVHKSNAAPLARNQSFLS